MNRSLYGVWLAITWIVTVGIAYFVGWYSGAKSATNVALSAVHSSFSYILAALAIVGIVSAIAAFKARGYLSTPQARS